MQPIIAKSLLSSQLLKSHRQLFSLAAGFSLRNKTKATQEVLAAFVATCNIWINAKNQTKQKIKFQHQSLLPATLNSLAVLHFQYLLLLLHQSAAITVFHNDTHSKNTSTSAINLKTCSEVPYSSALKQASNKKLIGLQKYTIIHWLFKMLCNNWNIRRKLANDL